MRVWGSLEVGERLEATTIMLANGVSVRRKVSDTFSSQSMRDLFQGYWEQNTENPLTGRDNIVASICPQLYGMYFAKLALAVILAGGVSKSNEGSNYSPTLSCLLHCEYKSINVYVKNKELEYEASHIFS